jgi:hypothetical protein
MSCQSSETDNDASDNVAGEATLQTCVSHAARVSQNTLHVLCQGEVQNTLHTLTLSRSCSITLIIRRDGADIPEARNDRGEHIVQPRIEKVRVGLIMIH